MSWTPGTEPTCPNAEDADLIETLVVPRARDIGQFEVRRALPSPRRQMVGPFIFFDQMGPVEFLTDAGIDVRPHPHIGLATVTYLFDGKLYHRDSLGTSMEIEPGAVNWMIAGRGITHSERTGPTERARQKKSLFGIQTWVALPEDAEETDPGFETTGADALPVIEDGGVSVRLILGTAYGARAPVSTFSEMFYGDTTIPAGSSLPLPDGHEDRAIYIVAGTVSIAGQVLEEGRMAIFRPGDRITISAVRDARIMILGGETLNGPRYIWWNFVASSREKIEAAKDAWKAGDWTHGRFTLPPDDNAEFIPAPDLGSARTT